MKMDGFKYGRVRLRWILVVIVLLAVTPVFALYLLRLRASSEAALEQAHERATILAREGAAAHDRIGQQARQLLELVSQIPAVRTATLPECDSFLKWIHDGRHWVTGIFVVSPLGKGVCGSLDTVKALDVSDRGYFRDAVGSGDFVLSDVIIGRLTHRPIIVGALPVYDKDANLQVIVGVGVDLPWINQLAAEAAAKYGGILIALDRNRQVVAYQPEMPPGWEMGQTINIPLGDTIMNSNSPSFEAVDPTGVRRIFGVSHLGDMTVAVGLKRSDVLGPTDRDFRHDFLFLLLVAAGSVGAALLVAEFGLLRGMRALKTAALRLKAGKMGLRVKLPAVVAAELHELAATYNAMTAEFERFAYLDRLTGLPNRRYLELYLSERNERGTLAPTHHQAVLAIDLDGFKPVNDSHGHAVGDKVLAAIARRIASVLDERGILARVGGDEFVVIWPLGETDDRNTARAFGEEIRTALERPIELDGVTFPVGCSIGIALVPDDAKSLAGALVVADAALYEAKRAGRNRVIDNAPPLAPEAIAQTEARRPHWLSLRLSGMA
jgi:diguanylate cyclase (GGDEF)-like protein